MFFHTALIIPLSYVAVGIVQFSHDKDSHDVMPEWLADVWEAFFSHMYISLYNDYIITIVMYDKGTC